MRALVVFGRLASVMVLTLAVPAQQAFAQPAPAAPQASEAKLTKPPKLVHFVEADYPESERARGAGASVLLEIAISESGAVTAVRVIESAGNAFDSAAEAAAQRFQFEPAEIDGKPAAIRIRYRYEFALERKAAAAASTAEFTGVVRDRNTGRPLAGVTVELGTGQRAVTDEHGEFRFDALTPGTVTVQLSGPALTPVRTDEALVAGQRVRTTYEVVLRPLEDAGEEAEDLEILVTAPAPLRKEVVATEIGSEQAKRVAGTQGDVVKVVENLPGVGRSGAGSGRLVVWGAAPEDTRIYVDGVRIPILYHSGGLRSVLLSDQVASVELVPGAYGPGYGRGLGGLVNVKLERFTPTSAGRRSHGSVGADLIDASANVRASLGDRFHVAAGVRKSYLDSVLPLFSDEDVGELFPIPRTTDAIARIAYVPSRRHSVELGGLYSSDAVDRTVPSVDFTRVKQERRELGFWRTWLRYDAELEDGSSVSLSPWFGRDENELQNLFGTTPTRLEVSSTFYGLRAAWRGRVSKFLSVSAGADGEIVASEMRRAGATTSPAREGDVRVFGQAPADQINFDRWNTVSTSVAPYGELDFGFFDDAFHVAPGLRFEPYLISVDHRSPVEGDEPSRGLTTEAFAVEPRLSLRYRPDRRAAFKAALGRYHQAPQPEDLSSVFGNPKLGVASGTHVLFGTEVQIFRELALETTVFFTRSEQLPVRSALSAPLIAEALVPTGEGRAFGIQVLLRKELMNRWFGWIAHSISRSERRNDENAAWRLSDYDQTHVSTLVTSYEPGLGFEFGARARVATGFPRTPVVGAFYDSRRDSFEPVFGAQNSSRIPAFWSIDLRVAKRIDIGDSELETYLDVQNVTNRENQEELVYSADYRERRAITGLPILPVVGARFSW